MTGASTLTAGGNWNIFAMGVSCVFFERKMTTSEWSIIGSGGEPVPPEVYFGDVLLPERRSKRRIA